MMERILQQQQPLCATLIEIRRSDLMPTDAEISNMEGFVEAIQPFAEITEVMGKEKQVSFSAVWLFLYKLLSIHLIEKLSDSGVMKKIKHVVKSDLEERYSDPHLMMLSIRLASWIHALNHFHFCQMKTEKCSSFC